MNKLVLFFVLVFVFGCSSPEDSLIGKWKEVERHFGGNLGGKASVEKVENGKVYTFKKDHKVSLAVDGLNYEGVYEVVQFKKDYILHTITSTPTESRPYDNDYRIYFTDSTTMKKLSITLVFPEGETLHENGRTYIFEKVE